MGAWSPKCRRPLRKSDIVGPPPVVASAAVSGPFGQIPDNSLDRRGSVVWPMPCSVRGTFLCHALLIASGLSLDVAPGDCSRRSPPIFPDISRADTARIYQDFRCLGVDVSRVLHDASLRTVACTVACQPASGSNRSSQQSRTAGI